MKECPACRRCFPDHINQCPHDGGITTHSIAGEPIIDERYQLERRLGHGGMGVVFKARHIFLKTLHAIKVILPDLVGNDPMLVTRFRQEALAAAAIRHPNIIAVTDFGVAGATMPFLVMEYVKGRSLHDLLAAEKILPPDRALEIIAAIGAGVGAAHRQNIVHRDLKALNIMLQDDLPVDEGLKILDFGLAKIKSGELLGSFVQAQTSGLMGSPFYMAPEQWSDEEPDARSDIYSLGVILYQMLGGEVPFKGTGIPSIMKKHLTIPPPSFSALGVQVPPAVESVVRHALEKEPQNRPPTVEAFISELRAAVSSVSPSLMATQPITAGVEVERVTPTPSPQSSFPKLPQVQDETVLLRVHTSPPRARVFINNVSVGKSDSAGDLVVPEMLRGLHRVRVVHEGFVEWERQIECNGGECRVDAQLQHSITASSPQIPNDPLAGTISSNVLDEELTKQQSLASIEAQRLHAQEEAALAEPAWREADEARRREQGRLEQERREQERARVTHEEETRRLADEARQRALEEAATNRLTEEAARLAGGEFTDQSDEAKSPLYVDENVQFTVFRPKKIKAEKPYKLLAFAHLSERRPDAEEDEPDPIEEVQRQAQRILGEQSVGDQDIKEDSSQPVPHDSEITFVPFAPGIEFNPASRSFRWRNTVHREEFEMVATKNVAGQTVKGRLMVFLGSLILAEINLNIRVESASTPDPEISSLEKASARRFRKVFASYSHKDAEIVQEFAQLAKVFGDEYLLDRTHLITGEDWREGLKRLIKQADVFQLFWSSNSMSSPHVRNELEYALSLNKPNFILPTYWEEPLPRRREENLPPAELERLHFQRIRPGIIIHSSPAGSETSAGQAERDPVAREEQATARIAATDATALTIDWEATQLQRQGNATQVVKDDSRNWGLEGGQPAQQAARPSLPSSVPAPVGAASRKSILPMILGMTLVAMLALGSGSFYLLSRNSATPTNVNNTGEGSNSEEARSPQPYTATGPEMINIPGGKFQMGRNTGPVDEAPAHTVIVGPFAMGKTEVTNLEYAEFVRETQHAPPSHWPGDKPATEQEQLPVTNVSWDDAKAFAAWRSQRDGVTYRLPTEEEWEYAARGGEQGSLYPWGNRWEENRAVTKDLGVISPQAVGSYPEGKTRWGCLDMIGNVWEWTSSTITLYQGNNQAAIPPEQQNWIVIRGGSYTSESRGAKGVTATTRKWVEASRKDPLLGFRLVRAGS